MKHVDEYRDQRAAQALAAAIRQDTTRPWTIMEICGGQTHAIVKYGIDALLPEKVRLVHGPGCPVCVTPVELIDKAVALAGRPEVIFCTFGDMMRVPGSAQDLLSVKAQGGDVRMVYSPLDAVKLARKHLERSVVFFAVGFETTAPANALAVRQAASEGLENFSILSSHVLVPPAIRAILSAKPCAVNGFLAAGHVCAVMGYKEYEPIAQEFSTPVVVTGFEPVDILQGILLCVRQLEQGHAFVENQYRRAVTRDGNSTAQTLVREVFQVSNRKWRGLGEIPDSGLALRPEYAGFSAEQRFGLAATTAEESSRCISGEILRGLKRPNECPAFALECVPERPLGAPMVSNEGACAAYYRYRRDQEPAVNTKE